MLRLENFGVRYGAVEAVRGVSLEVSAGEVVALLGANGAGKSSILKGILGLVTAAGRIVLDGRPIDGLPTHERVAAGLALSPEGRHVFQDLSVADNLELGYRSDGPAHLADRVEEVTELFPKLRQRFRQKAGTMSGGEQQMVAIARALMSAPKVLMLDEPTLGLAPIVVAELGALLARLRGANLAILLAERTPRWPWRRLGGLTSSRRGGSSCPLRPRTCAATRPCSGHSWGCDVRERPCPRWPRDGRRWRKPVKRSTGLFLGALLMNVVATSAADEVGRVPPVSDEAAPRAVAETFAAIRRQGGNPTTMHRAVANAPEAFAAYVGLAHALRMDDHVPRALRELAILRTLQIEGGDYEIGSHTRMALSCGLSAAQIAAMQTWRSSSDFDTKQRAVLQWVEDMATPGGPDAASYRTIAEHFDHRAIVQLTLSAGFYAMAARTTKALELRAQQRSPSSQGGYGTC